MKIGIITDQFPAVSETWVTREVQSLREEGHEVTVIARQLNPSAEFAWCPQHQVALSPHRALAALQCLLAWATTRPAHPQVVGARHDFPFGERMRRLFRYAAIRKLSFDNVHAHFGSVGAHYDFIPATHHCAYEVTFHGYDLRRGERDGGARYHHLFRQEVTIIAISDYTREKLLGFGCPPEKIKYKPLGVDARLFFPAERKHDPALFRLLTVARLVPEKHLKLAIRAVAGVARRHPGMSIRYRLIGEGPEREALERCAAEEGLLVEMPGAATPAAIADEMRGADVFLLSSRQEVAPVVIAEAIATRLPVVATDVGAVAEMVGAQHGIVTPPDDVAALQKAIEHYLPPASTARNVITNRTNNISLKNHEAT
ncbi:MAG: glycosyltransferase [Spartobacteria bacterium]|nr:glycosyltransferase [Spartobacteria bacterium]